MAVQFCNSPGRDYQTMMPWYANDCCTRGDGGLNHFQNCNYYIIIIIIVVVVVVITIIILQLQSRSMPLCPAKLNKD